MAALTLIGGGAGVAALLRTRAQNKKDSADAQHQDAVADAARATAFQNLWTHVNAMESEYARKLAEVRAELHSDIEAKDIRLKRLEADVIALKQKLSEWRAYALGLYDMLVKLKQVPPPPPDTGPLKT